MEKIKNGKDADASELFDEFLKALSDQKVSSPSFVQSLYNITYRKHFVCSQPSCVYYNDEFEVCPQIICYKTGNDILSLPNFLQNHFSEINNMKSTSQSCPLCDQLGLINGRL